MTSWASYMFNPGTGMMEEIFRWELERTVSDPVTKPAHYTKGKIEVIDFIEDQGLGYHLGNVCKYICRAAHKGYELQDLKKARWYLDRKIAKLEALHERK